MSSAYKVVRILMPKYFVLPFIKFVNKSGRTEGCFHNRFFVAPRTHRKISSAQNSMERVNVLKNYPFVRFFKRRLNNRKCFFGSFFGFRTISYLPSLFTTSMGFWPARFSMGTRMKDFARQKQTLQKGTSDGTVTPIRETTHYLIPAADLEFGTFSTHHTLERQGFMRVIMFTRRATIRRWHGDSLTPPEDAPVIFDAAINFGKPNVDIFEIPALFEDALLHLTSLCRAETKPVPHAFRER
jgi:hypothetical protein